MALNHFTCFYITNKDGDRYEARVFCDNSEACQPRCDGHEANNGHTRCNYCYWAPCNCETMERIAEARNTYKINNLGY